MNGKLGSVNERKKRKEGEKWRNEAYANIEQRGEELQCKGT